MDVYQGVGRRQVGGGIWATRLRGLIPIIKSAGTKLLKRFGKSAVQVGTDVAGNYLASGKLNKNMIKSAVKKEGTQLRSEAMEKLKGFKRKFQADNNDQSGSGHKRRRIAKKPVTKKMPRRKGSNKRSASKARKSGGGGKKKRYTRKTASKSTPRRTKRGRVAKKQKRRKRQGKKAVNDIFSQKK